MQAFHNDPLIKEKYLNRVKKHREMDDFRRGFYWDNGRGCAIGCTIERSSNVHESYQYELGIPLPLVFLQDVIFENMDYEDALEYPEKFLQSISVGANLDAVDDQIILWLLTDPDDGIISHVSGKTKDILEEIVPLVQREAAGEKVPIAEWTKPNWIQFQWDVADMPYIIGGDDREANAAKAACAIILYYQDDGDAMNVMFNLARAKSDPIQDGYFDRVAAVLLEFLSAAKVEVNMLTPNERLVQAKEEGDGQG